MKGRIKWFSNEKGFGFVVGDDGEDRFFSVRDLQGIELPKNGDFVEFQPTEGKKGPKAKNIKITKKGERNLAGKAICNHCGKAMIPRIITGRPIIHAQGGWTPVPKRSICTFCGKTHKKFPITPGEIIKLVIAFFILLIVIGLFL